MSHFSAWMSKIIQKSVNSPWNCSERHHIFQKVPFITSRQVKLESVSHRRTWQQCSKGLICQCLILFKGKEKLILAFATWTTSLLCLEVHRLAPWFSWMESVFFNPPWWMCVLQLPSGRGFLLVWETLVSLFWCRSCLKDLKSKYLLEHWYNKEDLVCEL